MWINFWKFNSVSTINNPLIIEDISFLTTILHSDRKADSFTVTIIRN